MLDVDVVQQRSDLYVIFFGLDNGQLPTLHRGSL